MSKTTSKFIASAVVASTLFGAPFQAAHAGLITKAFIVGSIVVGKAALSKSQATQHCTQNPTDVQCEKIKGTDADPALVGTQTGSVPQTSGAVHAAKDPNAMIDAGAAKAKGAIAKTSAWFNKAIADHAARKAERDAAAKGTPAPTPAVTAPTPAQ